MYAKFKLTNILQANEEPVSHENFKKDLINAQVIADKTKSGVKVHYDTYSTMVDPNLPPFTKKELNRRLSEALKAILAEKMLEKNRPKLPSTIDVVQDDVDEVTLSPSILNAKRDSVIYLVDDFFYIH